MFVVVAGVLAILRPWTVVPIHTATPRGFEPVSYVTSIWDSRVLPTADRSAIDLKSFLRERTSTSGARAVFVKGTATVDEIDRKSRVGLARLAFTGMPHGHVADLQIGPVIRGTALRDALDFIRFTDFVNQLEFAGVASALNDHVVSSVLQTTTDLVSGAEVSFVGAVPVSGALEIVPVKLAVASHQ
jgi:predicted lipoprotein